MFEDLKSQGCNSQEPPACHVPIGRTTVTRHRLHFPACLQRWRLNCPRKPGPEWAEETAKVEWPRMLMGPGREGSRTIYSYLRDGYFICVKLEQNWTMKPESGSRRAEGQLDPMQPQMYFLMVSWILPLGTEVVHAILSEILAVDGLAI